MHGSQNEMNNMMIQGSTQDGDSIIMSMNDKMDMDMDMGKILEIN